MMISEETQNILRNFSSINPSILLTGNNRIATMSVMRNILATADIEERVLALEDEVFNWRHAYNRGRSLYNRGRALYNKYH